MAVHRLAEQAPPMVEYRCKYCGWWLMTSDAERGRTEVKCQNNRCGKRQMVFFGGQRGRADLHPDTR